jgi:hypothetical protein
MMVFSKRSESMDAAFLLCLVLMAQERQMKWQSFLLGVTALIQLMKAKKSKRG